MAGVVVKGLGEKRLDRYTNYGMGHGKEVGKLEKELKPRSDKERFAYLINLAVEGRWVESGQGKWS
jgi:hypothetical protein